MERLTRAEQKEQTRAGLVENAEILFAKNGIGATTTAEIANALRVSHGTLFVHFPTRDDLIFAVVESFGEKLRADLERSLHDEMSVRQILRAHIGVLADREDLYLRLISESRSLSPRVRDLLCEMNGPVLQRLDQAVRSLMNDGEVKRMRSSDLFNTWLAMVHYSIMNRSQFSEKTPVLGQLGDGLVQHFLSLIKVSYR